ncbi:transposase [Streptomyces poriticola]|uniref:transposase n=1 Tax=Streptomyces poriticola TaxID=3120506 RepID=UPI002FCE5653
MTDAEWAAVRPLLPVPDWMQGRGGQPEAYCHRAMLDALRYLMDNGIKWRCRRTSRGGTACTPAFAGGVTTAWSGSTTTDCGDRSARRWAGMRSRVRV